MGYPYPYYAMCEQGSNIDRRRLYQTCFNNLLHANHAQDEHPYFLQFRAAALSSIITNNKSLVEYSYSILSIVDTMVEWSMTTMKHFNQVERYDVWRSLQPMHSGNEVTGYLVDDIGIKLPLWSFYIEGNDVLN